MKISNSKDVKILVINYAIFIILSIIFFGVVLEQLDSGNLKIIAAGIFLIICSIWGQVLGIVFLRLPGCSFIYKKELYVKFINVISGLTGISLIVWGSLL